jgi:hypothetical protein
MIPSTRRGSCAGSASNPVHRVAARDRPLGVAGRGERIGGPRPERADVPDHPDRAADGVVAVDQQTDSRDRHRQPTEHPVSGLGDRLHRDVPPGHLRRMRAGTGQDGGAAEGGQYGGGEGELAREAYRVLSDQPVQGLQHADVLAAPQVVGGEPVTGWNQAGVLLPRSRTKISPARAAVAATASSATAKARPAHITGTGGSP